MAYLEVNNLTKTFEDKKISADFSLEASETLCILGPSGSGKTTILAMIAGFIAPDSGAVILDNTDITSEKPYRRNIGMVFQNYALFPHLNVFENVAFGLHSFKLPKTEIRNQVEKMLAKFEIAHLETRSIQNLSGGEKQRVALARTLITKPKLILFDEPLSALDTDLRKKLQVELKKLQRRERYCAVYVTHDEDEAAFLSDRRIELGGQSH